MRFIIKISTFALLFSFLFQYSSSTNSDDNNDTQYIDDSNLSDSLKNQYRNDAARLAILQMHQDPILKTEIIVPDSLITKYYGALIAVYNSNIEKAKKVKNIHDFRSSVIKEFLLVIDTSASWMENWKNGNIITGINQLDELIATYNIEINSVNTFSEIHMALILIKTEDYVNYTMFPNLFHGIDKIKSAEHHGMIGGGGYISTSINNGSIILTYSIGWGDCLSGCISKHYWEFSVKRNKVKFIREYGDLLL
jgi:hypothetical protein